MFVSEMCRSVACRVVLPWCVGLSAGREVAPRRAPSCGVPVGAVCVCVRVQDWTCCMWCAAVYCMWCVRALPLERAPGWGLVGTRRGVGSRECYACIVQIMLMLMLMLTSTAS